MRTQAASAQRTVSQSRQLVLSYALFIAVASVLVAGFATPAFRISRVSVIGSSQAAYQIENATGVVGKNIFTIRAASMLRAIEGIPNILVTCVRVSLPNTVTVCATMRQPVVGWRTKDGLYLVDKFGRVISQVSTTNLLTVRDTTRLPISVGQQLNPWLIEDILYTTDTLSSAEIDRVTLGTKKGLLFRSSHGWRALIGIVTDRDALRKKVGQLAALLTKVHSLQYVDLTGQSPIIRLADLAGGS